MKVYAAAYLNMLRHVKVSLSDIVSDICFVWIEGFRHLATCLLNISTQYIVFHICNGVPLAKN